MSLKISLLVCHTGRHFKQSSDTEALINSNKKSFIPFLEDSNKFIFKKPRHQLNFLNTIQNLFYLKQNKR